jgi:hypothetical protein
VRLRTRATAKVDSVKKYCDKELGRIALIEVKRPAPGGRSFSKMLAMFGALRNHQ